MLVVAMVLAVIEAVPVALEELDATVEVVLEGVVIFAELEVPVGVLEVLIEVAAVSVTVLEPLFEELLDVAFVATPAFHFFFPIMSPNTADI